MMVVVVVVVVVVIVTNLKPQDAIGAAGGLSVLLEIVKFRVGDTELTDAAIGALSHAVVGHAANQARTLLSQPNVTV